jgi:hypothetical protein
MDVNAPAFVPGMLSADAVEFVPLARVKANNQTGMSSEAPEFVPGTLPGISNVSLDSDLAMGYGGAADLARAATSPEQEWGASYRAESELEAAAMWTCDATADEPWGGVSQRWHGDEEQFLSTKVVCTIPQAGVSVSQKETSVRYMEDMCPGRSDQEPSAIPFEAGARWDCGSAGAMLEDASRRSRPQRVAPVQSVPTNSIPSVRSLESVQEVVGSKVALDVLFPNLEWQSREDEQVGGSMPRRPQPVVATMPAAAVAALSTRGTGDAVSSMQRIGVRSEFGSAPDWDFGDNRWSAGLLNTVPQPCPQGANRISSTGPAGSRCTPYRPLDALAKDSVALNNMSSNATEGLSPSHEDWNDASGLAESVAAMALGDFLDEDGGRSGTPTPTPAGAAEKKALCYKPQDRMSPPGFGNMSSPGQDATRRGDLWRSSPAPNGVALPASSPPPPPTAPPPQQGEGGTSLSPRCGGASQPQLQPKQTGDAGARQPVTGAMGAMPPPPSEPPPPPPAELAARQAHWSLRGPRRGLGLAAA